MTNGQKEKVVIVGGGMAALTAAYHLSSTREMRDRYQVTLYQMGWRLGGKCASSRDEQGRNVEHGLHVWFGCYDNAFGLMRSVYGDWSRQDVPSLAEAFKPRFESRIGTSADLSREWVRVAWPDAPGLPWEPPRAHTLSPLAIVGRLIDHVLELVQASDDLEEVPVEANLRLDDAELRRQSRSVMTNGVQDGLQGDLQFAENYLMLAHDVIEKADGTLGEPMAALNAAALTRTLVTSSLDSLTLARRRSPDESSIPHYIEETIELVRALITGLINDLIIGGETLDSLDDKEFRDWLVSHGASRETVTTSPFLKALYDTMFQYPGGDQSSGDYAAGTALQVVTRLLGTYRGAPLFIPRYGLGEIVIAPLYEVLVQHGVDFEFFHKLHRMSPNRSGDQVGALTFHQQATPKGGDYNPIGEFEGLPYWPERPFWEQLVEEDIPEDTDFESHWNAHPPVGEKTLNQGSDFDHVILGVSIGALASFDGQPGLASELQQRCPALDRLVQNTPLVPSKAAQVWFRETADELGQEPPRHAAVSGSEAFDIYADMSQVLASEPEQGPEVRSLFYLCTTYDTELYKRPASEADTPTLAHADVRERFEEWKGNFGLDVWPEAGGADGEIDPKKIVHEVVKANINPTDCCPSSAAGATKHRLPASGTTFENLYLAGCWTRIGFNTTCVESAVMSGMQAARALSGEPRDVFAENFLREWHHFDLIREPLGCIDQLLERFSPFAHARFSSGSGPRGNTESGE